MTQEIITGDGAIVLLENLLAKHVLSRPFIITGDHLVKLRSELFPFAHDYWTKDGANVLQDETEACTTFFESLNADTMIVVGGGSAIDLAKTVLYNTTLKGFPLPFFICAPSTAGSGSEATCFAVVYQNKIKVSLEAHELLPRLVILDAELTYSLSPNQTAISGIDALAQAIESYWNIHANELSQTFSKRAIILLLQYLPVAVSNPNPEARRKILEAAHLAGKAINITRTTGPHALSYYLTANYNVEHGQAVALFLPIFFLYNCHVNASNCNNISGKDKVLTDLSELCSLLKVNTIEDACTYLQNFIKGIGLATKFTELKIDKFAIMDPLIESINEQRFGNNPVSLNLQLLKELFVKHL